MAASRGVTTKKLVPLAVVLGPTASGKSDWVNSFAHKFNGEVVSADSRQVFKDFSIGTNKEKGKWKKRENKPQYVVDGIDYHLIDFVSPKAYFNVYEYQKKAQKTIQDIHKRGHLPFISGGTGMYIDAVVDNWELIEESYDEGLRKELSGKSNIELLKRLQVSDPQGAKKIDMHNTARLIRAIEIIELTGKKKANEVTKAGSLYTTIKIGISKEREELYRHINKRVELMFEEGLLEEVQRLQKVYETSLPVFYSIGYKELVLYLNGESTLEEAKDKIKQNTRHYAKRQMTWWRRDKTVIWCKTKKEAEQKIREFHGDF